MDGLLHHAASNGHTKTARVLVDEGADVDAKDSDGRIPFEFVDGNAYEEELRALLLRRCANEA